MCGKTYYLTTLAAWQRHAHRFNGSHWIALDDAAPAVPTEPAPGEGNSPLARPDAFAADSRTLPTAPDAIPDESASLHAAMPILVLVEGDEGAHLALESDADFTPLPHPLAQKAIPAAAQSAIAASGIAIPDRATTFDAAESLARVHPLLRYRVF